MRKNEIRYKLIKWLFYPLKVSIKFIEGADRVLINNHVQSFDVKNDCMIIEKLLSEIYERKPFRKNTKSSLCKLYQLIFNEEFIDADLIADNKRLADALKEAEQNLTAAYLSGKEDGKRLMAEDNKKNIGKGE